MSLLDIGNALVSGIGAYKKNEEQRSDLIDEIINIKTKLNGRPMSSVEKDMLRKDLETQTLDKLAKNYTTTADDYNNMALSNKKQNLASAIVNMNPQWNKAQKEALQQQLANMSEAEIDRTAGALAQKEFSDAKLGLGKDSGGKGSALADLKFKFNEQYLKNLKELSGKDPTGKKSNTIQDKATAYDQALNMFNDQLKQYPEYANDLLKYRGMMIKDPAELFKNATTKDEVNKILYDTGTAYTDFYNKGVPVDQETLAIIQTRFEQGKLDKNKNIDKAENEQYWANVRKGIGDAFSSVFTPGNKNDLAKKAQEDALRAEESDRIKLKNGVIDEQVFNARKAERDANTKKELERIASSTKRPESKFTYGPISTKELLNRELIDNNPSENVNKPATVKSKETTEERIAKLKAIQDEMFGNKTTPTTSAPGNDVRMSAQARIKAEADAKGMTVPEYTIWKAKQNPNSIVSYSK